MPKSKDHLVIVKVRFSAPVTPKEARYELWNEVGNAVIFCGNHDRHGAKSFRIVGRPKPAAEGTRS